MINIRNLLASQANELKHKENLKKQRAFQSSPLQSISPKENEKLIKIDKFIFSVFHNIESIDYELNLGITKVESISTNYYLKLGGNEERVSFEARVFVEYLEHFNGLVAKIKQRVPLSYSSLESSVNRKIIIDKFHSKSKDWLMDNSRNITYHTKELSSSGVLV